MKKKLCVYQMGQIQSDKAQVIIHNRGWGRREIIFSVFFYPSTEEETFYVIQIHITQP